VKKPAAFSHYSLVPLSVLSRLCTLRRFCISLAAVLWLLL